MRTLRCKCGDKTMWTTDSPRDCQGCEKCATTFAGHPDNHKPLQPHEWIVDFNQSTGKPYKRCGNCYQIDEETFKLSNQKDTPMPPENVDEYYKHKNS